MNFSNELAGGKELSSYIINTDPHWFSFVFSRGLKNPVFWRKRPSSPNRAAVVPGNPIFFRVTHSNPPVISAHGVLAGVHVSTLTEAFRLYDHRLGYPTMEEMINSSATWTSGVRLQPGTRIYCMEISNFQVVKDIRTDTELEGLGIDFDHRHVVTGKELDAVQTTALLNYAQLMEERPVGSLVSFIDHNITSDAVDEFNPQNTQDAREKIARLVAKRRGQPEFRKKLLAAYSSRCAITGCDAVAALEAAHIVPYRGPHTNHVTNGLLLRADLHTLFDLGLIAIDSDTMTVIVHPDLAATEYKSIAGKPIALPKNRQQRPNKEALDMHRREAGL